MSGQDGEPEQPDPERTDALLHLAFALLRLDMTMHPIKRLSVRAIHEIATILDTEPGEPQRYYPAPED